jgi:predicted nucleic acid-binding protein
LIFLDTNVVSELGLPVVTTAEIAFGIQKIHPRSASRPARPRPDKLAPPLADRIFGFTEAAALAYGDIMATAFRQGPPMTAPDGMIAATARINGARLATRNLAHFTTTGIELICPWNF